MRTFDTVRDGKILFESVDELIISEARSIETDKVSTWTVEFNGRIYEVPEATYAAIKEEKGIA